MSDLTRTGGSTLQVATKGEVDPGELEYVTARLEPVVADIRAPVLFARLLLEAAPDPARDRPAMARLTLDVDGDLVRAQVAGHDMREAGDLLKARLRDQLEHRAQRREALHTSAGIAEPGEWRRGHVAAPRPPYYDRPEEEREVVRRKTFVIDEISPDEAAFDMDQLDYDFYLFRELGTGEDAFLERVDDGYRLTRRSPGGEVATPTAIPLEVADRAPPVASLDEAVLLLEDRGGRAAFFVDRRTGRGNVLYRRYDGHYGLISPE